MGGIEPLGAGDGDEVAEVAPAQHRRRRRGGQEAPRRFQRRLVAVDAQQPAVRADALQDQPGMTSGADRAIDVGATRPGLEKRYGRL